MVDTSEELRKQFEIEKTEFQNDIENYKEQIAQQYAQIEKLKDQIKELEARQPEKVVETVTVTKEVDGDEATVSVAAVVNHCFNSSLSDIQHYIRFWVKSFV